MMADDRSGLARAKAATTARMLLPRICQWGYDEDQASVKPFGWASQDCRNERHRSPSPLEATDALADARTDALDRL